MKPKNPYPQYLNSTQARSVNMIRFKITKILKEFNRRGFSYKAKLELDYCKPSICGEEKIIFYKVSVINPKAEDPDEQEIASISLLYNLTEEVRDFNFVIMDKPRIKLEDVLNMLFLAAHIAKEFYEAER